MKNTKTPKKELTLAAEVLLYIFSGMELLPGLFAAKTVYLRKRLSNKSSYKTYLNLLNRLEEKGLIKIYKDEKKKTIQLTKEGQLEVLFIKAKLPDSPLSWDGKWRMVIFDIPEDNRDKRNQLRSLLKINGFVQVQKSVFINPFPLNREAIVYLKQTGLDKYIRIFRVDEADNDSDLKKKFGL